ncbi:hypothetical protein DB29_02623 [Shouchella clausii]|jgi:hypothetical protein|nr:hypothetical protein DB29_02623 [Shouchella clausii]
MISCTEKTRFNFCLTGINTVLAALATGLNVWWRAAMGASLGLQERKQ